MITIRRALLAVSLCLAAPAALAAMHADPVQWTVGDKAFEGVLVYDDSSTVLRPGLVMVPDWMGMTDAAVAKAKHVAGDDYVVLVADVWGKGTQPKDNRDAGAMAGALRDDILISADDLRRLGLHEGARVRLQSRCGSFSGTLRTAAIKPGNLQAHWPEANVLLGTTVDPDSLEPDYNAAVFIEEI